MANPVKNSYLRRWTKGFHIYLSHQSHSHAILEKHHPAKPPKTHIDDPNFLTTHMNLSINRSLWPAVLKSNVTHQECTAGPCSSDILHSFEQSKLHKCIFWIWTLQIFTCIRAWQLIRALISLPTGIGQFCSSQGATAIPLYAWSCGFEFGLG